LDKGIELTITVTAYDKGIANMNGNPVGSEGPSAFRMLDAEAEGAGLWRMKPSQRRFGIVRWGRPMR